MAADNEAVKTEGIMIRPRTDLVRDYQRLAGERLARGDKTTPNKLMVEDLEAAMKARRQKGGQK